MTGTAWGGRRLLVVVAHPDDESFGCGSVIADAVAGGAQVVVCCATRGEAGEVPPDCDLGGGTLGELRERELRDAAAVLGVDEVVVLDFVDSDMHGEAGPATLVGAPLAAVVDAVAEVVARVDPDVVVTLDAGGGDGHRDHVRIAEATTEAVRRSGAGATLYSWTVVRSLLLRWLEALREGRPDAGHLQLDEDGLGRPDGEVTTVVDVSPHLERRRAAMAVHGSQRPPYDDMDVALAEAFLRHDRFVRVEPPWEGGPLEEALLVRRR